VTLKSNVYKNTLFTQRHKQPLSRQNSFSFTNRRRKWNDKIGLFHWPKQETPLTLLSSHNLHTFSLSLCASAPVLFLHHHKERCLLRNTSEHSCLCQQCSDQCWVATSSHHVLQPKIYMCHYLQLCNKCMVFSFFLVTLPCFLFQLANLVIFGLLVSH